jgi:methyl-accepting chemotaxis protein
MNTVDSKKVEEELEKIYSQIDKYAVQSIWLNILIAAVLTVSYENWLIGIIGSLILVAIQLITYELVHNRIVKSYAMSISFCLWSLLFIMLSNGIIEIRYIYFVYVFMVALYQMPRLVIVCYFITIVVTLVFFLPILYEWEMKSFNVTYFLEESGATFPKLAITILSETLVCIFSYFYALRLQQNTKVAIHKKLEDEIKNKQLDKNLLVAKEIANGNFDLDFAVAEGDILGKALDEMRQNLLAAATKEAQDRFINVGIAEISEILRNQYKDTAELCNALISKLVKYLNANQGAIFILQEDEGKASYLQLVACYAYQKRRYVEKKIQAGEGLPGQVLLEKLPIYLTNIPPDYVRITSGLGEATPRYLLLMPLIANEEIVGVIEIASFQAIPAHEQQFMQKAAESIAITINSVRIAEKTKQLLHESQLQTEQMMAQEEEMRQNMEELVAIQEQTERQNKENEKLLMMLKARQDELEKTEEELRKIDIKNKELIVFFKQKMEDLDIELEQKNNQIRKLKKEILKLQDTKTSD